MATRCTELGVTFRLSSRVISVDFSNSIVTIEGGETVSGDVVICADGLWSTTRAQFLGKPSPAILTGDLAYRIVINTSELSGPDAPELKQFIEQAHVNFWVGPETHVVAYTMRAGAVYNIVLLCPDNLPESITKTEGDLDEMKGLFEGWDPILVKFLNQVKSVAKWKLMWLEQLPEWANKEGSFIMIGDCCHPMLPYLAQGANSSLEDGAVLGYLLGNVTLSKKEEQLPKSMMVGESGWVDFDVAKLIGMKEGGGGMSKSMNQHQSDPRPEPIESLATSQVERSKDEEIAQLRAQLEELKRQFAELQPQPQLIPKSIKKDAVCFFLKTIPVEVRNMIYELLLCNTELSHTGILRLISQYATAPRTRYDLSPSILRTSHQTYREASTIFYGKNTFIVDLSRTSELGPIRTPVNRGPMTVREIRGYRDLEVFQQLAAVKRVRNWKVVISTASLPPKSETVSDPKLTLFARAICDNPPRSLQLALVPESSLLAELAGMAESAIYESRQFEAFRQILQPLCLISNIPKVDIIALKVDQQMELRKDKGDGDREYNNFMDDNKKTQMYEVSKSALVAARTAVKHIMMENAIQPLAYFKMCENLIGYAQTFERNEEVRKEMAPNYAACMWNHLGLGSKSDSRPGHNLVNTYAGLPCLFTDVFKEHPVEAAIKSTIICSDGSSPHLFQEARWQVLEYLEPQYQSIVRCASNISIFIKENKARNCSFDPDFKASDVASSRNYNLGSAMLLLEEYAASFKRDMPAGSRDAIRASQRLFDLAYSTLPRESLMKRLIKLLDEISTYKTSRVVKKKHRTRMRISETGIYGEKVIEFIQNFKVAVDDMDRQYLAIRAARKALFMNDMYEDDIHGKIDLELSRCDEKIDWGVLEPKTGPLTAAEAWQLKTMGKFLEEAEEYVDITGTFCGRNTGQYIDLHFVLPSHSIEELGYEKSLLHSRGEKESEAC
ncbi:hypothetical protein G7Y89_g12725 [Cudoniella acicularis]|uniref:FAD-binding domain-containing protein n=1 Tax=Cudoniella acicularis TaxID=354080 RepID=A0A8H4R8K9_9HELO|nr:hypothetical protein G7Y89_g12725 [Cudoniella acicularis]